MPAYNNTIYDGFTRDSIMKTCALALHCQHDFMATQKAETVDN